MKTVCRGVLNGLISFCGDMKNSSRLYGLACEKRLQTGRKVILKGGMGKDVLQLSTVPNNLIKELRRIRSIDGDMDRIGYDSLILKFYKAEMKSKSVFEN